jgi:predicted dehydrogenase
LVNLKEFQAVAPNSQRLQVAIIGCGAVVSLYYTPALKELEAHNLVQVKALFDPNPERTDLLKKQFPDAVAVEQLTDLAAMGIDLGVVASPPRYHAEQTIQLLESGLAVLCEKPMATTVVDGEVMVKVASQAQRPLAIGLFRRFFPATHTIRDILMAGLLGQVQSFYCYEGGPFRWPVQSASFFQKDLAGGGVLLDIGVHLLDLLIWWWGYPVEASYEDDALGGLEANCRINLTFAEGFSGEVRLSRDWAQPNHYVIYCEKGWLSWEVNNASEINMGLYDTKFALNGQLYENKFNRQRPSPGQPAYTFEQSFVAQLRNVVCTVRGIEEPAVPGQEGLESLKLIEYCYQHRSLMAMPWLGEAERSRVHQLGF